jgi:hypothetical protein
MPPKTRAQRPAVDPRKLPYPKPQDSTEYNLGFRDVRGSHHLSCEPRFDGGKPFCLSEGPGDWDILLRQSAEHGNVDEVKRALQKGAVPDSRNEWVSFLMLSAEL